MRIILLLFLFIVSASTYGQGFFERHPQLSKYTEAINQQLNSYKTVTLKNGEFLENLTDGGGTLIGYFSGKELVKIELEVGISYGKYQYDYYFKDSELYYIVETFNQYSYDVDSDTWDYSKLEQNFRGDYVFQPDFDYETLGHNRFEDDTLDPEKVLKEEALEYSEILKKK
ncbi:MAG: hypothetical protein RLO12_18455 [Fulvivirga sp.]|uniref:hypothetical protein n=1 Tax=Fulvivirga sp. TaxID=1931237 RepID=UPI0032FBE9E9